MHRPWTGRAAAVDDICALHPQRQLSAKGACKFEGRILQAPGQAHAPEARAMMDIAQHADRALRLSYCGRRLAHRSYAFRRCSAQRLGERPLNVKVDNARGASLRKAEIYKPDTAPSCCAYLQGAAVAPCAPCLLARMLS